MNYFNCAIENVFSNKNFIDIKYPHDEYIDIIAKCSFKIIMCKDNREFDTLFTMLLKSLEIAVKEYENDYDFFQPILSLSFDGTMKISLHMKKKEKNDNQPNI